MAKIIFLIFFKNSILYLAISLGGIDFECFYQKKSYLEKRIFQNLKKFSTLDQVFISKINIKKSKKWSRISFSPNFTTDS
jgi:hypothetical protein